MTGSKISIGVTGMGGYAGHMLDWFLSAQGVGAPVRVAAVCEPHPENFPQLVSELSHRQIAILTNYADLLNEKTDAVYLPIPISLHRSFTEQALTAGRGVLCEKPAAGCVDDVDAMIAARDRAGVPAAIAFQDVYQPKLHLIKQRILDGEFGAITQARVLACWPRDEAYFHRNDWAGRIGRPGRWILDSPANNAMAHYIHLCLFLLGPDQSRSASPMKVEAELYRANEIENYDTCSLRLSLKDRPSVLIGLTHATDQQVNAEIKIVAERGIIQYHGGHRVDIFSGERTEQILLDQPMQLPMFQSFRNFLVGAEEDEMVGTLEMARCHTVVINAASEAANIVPVTGKNAQRIINDRGGIVHVIPGINQALRQSIDDGQMLHESGLADWSRPAAMIDTEHYTHFRGPAKV